MDDRRTGSWLFVSPAHSILSVNKYWAHGRQPKHCQAAQRQRLRPFSHTQARSCVQEVDPNAESNKIKEKKNATGTKADHSSSQNSCLSTPLLDAIEQEKQRVRANFFYPGHKQGVKIHKSVEQLLGNRSFAADLPELPELDNLFAPEGAIHHAQTLFANTFTAEGSDFWTSHFLVNGSTCGVEAAFLATVRPGRKVILPRNSHQSAVHALVLSGAVPVWIDPVYDSINDLLHGVTPSSVEMALREYGEDVDAVFIVSPTYHGVVSDIREIAQLTHRSHGSGGGVKLIVDEAHGAHLFFHDALPRSAVECGADIVVQSVHKTLTALSQAAVMHVRRQSTVDERRVQGALQLVQSSSPSYLLLASLDAARALVQDDGKQLIAHVVKLARSCARRIASLDGFSVLGVNNFGITSESFTSVLTSSSDTETQGREQEAPIYDLDVTKITVILPPGCSGYDLDVHLIDRFGVYAELPLFRHVTFAVTVGTTQQDVDNLVTALSLYAATETNTPTESNTTSVVLMTKLPNWRGVESKTNVMTPRDAFFSDSEVVSAEEAVGRVCAETLCPYPPGIPVLLPGEVVTKENLDVLHRVLSGGGSVSGAIDESVSKIRVVL